MKFGAGLTLGRAVLELYNSSNLILSAGDVPSVGLTGIILGGGQGFQSRLYGLTSDFVSAVDLVTESGQSVSATKENEYSDNLWLTRGGVSGVQHYPGIIAGVELRGLPYARRKNEKCITHFRIDWEPSAINAREMLLFLADVSS